MKYEINQQEGGLPVIRLMRTPLAVLLSLFFVSFFASVPAMAAEVIVIDDAVLFTDSELSEIESRAQEISDRYDINIIVATTYEPGFSDNEARDYIEEYGVGRYPEGYLAYAVNMSDRSYWVDAYGDEERRLFTQDVTDTLADVAYDELSDGEYAGSAMAFLNRMDQELQVRTDPYGWLKKPFIFWKRTLIVSFIATIFSIILTVFLTITKVNKHKDKQEAYDAAGYGSDLILNVNESQFVSHYQTRVAKPKESSHSSSGGGSSGHTGSGGHF